MENVVIHIYESASSCGDWHVVITVDGVVTESYTAFSFSSVLSHAALYLSHAFIQKECL